MEKVFITIDLKQHLHDFLIHEFKEDDQGAVVLNLRNDIGKYLNSMWSPSPCPKPPREMENPVRLLLPETDDNHYIIKNCFLYVPVWKEKMINDYLEAEWSRRIKDIFSIGYQKKFQQKDIIDGILKYYGIKNNSLNFDQIKQFDYRSRERFKRMVINEIQSAII